MEKHGMCIRVGVLFAVTLLSACSLHNAIAQDAKLTPKALQQLLADNPTGQDAERLAGEARVMFGRNLTNGTVKKQDGLTLAFGIEIAGVKPNAGLRVTFSDGHANLPLQRIGETVVYAAVVTLSNLATGHWRMLQGEDLKTESDYELYAVDPASKPNPDVP